MMMMMMKKSVLAKASLLVLGMAAILVVVEFEIFSPRLYQTLGRNTKKTSTKIYIPSSLDEESQRGLSLNLGGGACKWQPPVYEVPEGVDFHKTLVTGFPSGDKRMVYLQMEALAGFPAKDEWDFAFEGMTNHPFIKCNYPHHEGIWGWGTAADQVVMAVPHIRRSMVEYHDILWDLGYPTSWEAATLRSDNLYGAQPQPEDYYEWRDSRVLDEAHWYGWFIDYWMEGGLFRDVFSHRLTTDDHFNDLLRKPFYTRAELAYENYVSNGTVVTKTYDPHCANGEISGGCEPIAVVSVDNLVDYDDGRFETSVVANALMNDARTGQFVIAQEAWDCIWDELIQKRKGPKVKSDRPGYQAMGGYNFAAEMLEEMIGELDRLIAKYDGLEWNTKATANRLVEILVEHRVSVQEELNEVNSGVRKLEDKDFLGPKERARRRDLKRKQNGNGEYDLGNERTDYSRYFIDPLQKYLEKKRLETQEAAKRHQDSTAASVSGVISDTLEHISDTLEKIDAWEAAGGIDHDAAKSLAESVEEIGEAVMPW